jgi:DnaJ homolog subfamily C member 7
VSLTNHVAVEAEPSNPTYLSNRAAAYISANKFDLALSDSLQANRLDPANDKILHRLARIYTSLGRPQDALDTYARIPGGVSVKDTGSAKTAIAAIQAAERVIDEENGSGTMALWNLEQAKQTLGNGVPWPRRWQILRARANLKIGSANSLGEVQGIATSMQRESSNDAEALVLAGRALYLRGEPKSHPGAKSDFQKAEECFKQALAMDPDMIEALKCLRMMRRLEKAKEDANAIFKARRYSEAVKAYSEALLVDPSAKMTNAKLLGNRALARIRIKEFDEATADCDAALKADPTYTKAKKTRAKAVGESGNWEQAVKDLKELAEADPSPEMQKEVRNAEMELKKSKRKDYYRILGVEKDADEQQIKRAYKKKALGCHPDKFPGDRGKEEEFKDLSEANECLMDPEKRQRYDSGVDLMEPGEMFGGGGGHGNPFGGGGMQLDPEMLFNMMNGGMGGGGRGGGMPHFSFQQGGGGARGGGFPF